MDGRGRWPDDTRGIVDPAEMMRHVQFARYPAGEALSGLIDWFWSVAWSLPDGTVHVQEVLNHPSGHISVGTVDDSGVPLDPAQGRVYGVLTGMSNRRLTGEGWTVAAKTTTGGLGVLLGRPARSITDQQLELTDALDGLDGGALVTEINKTANLAERIDHLRDALAAVVRRRDPALIDEARRVAHAASLAETDRTVRRVDDLATAANVSTRTLQRLFHEHVGVNPSWVIRRWRIIEAAEAAADIAADGEWDGWAALSDQLGYSDQAHMIRDFRRHLGTSPGHFLTRIRS